MPTIRREQSRGGRQARDSAVRSFSLWFVETVYITAIPLLSVVAVAIDVYAFSKSVGEGVRTIVYYVLPVLWGAYYLAVNDGKPQALTKHAHLVVVAVCVPVGLVLGGIFFLGAPISSAGLALGAMAAFFFLLWTSDQPSQYTRTSGPAARLYMLVFLIIISMVAITAAIRL